MILWGEVRTESTNLLTESFDEMIKIDYNKKEWVRLQSQVSISGVFYQSVGTRQRGRAV